MWQSSGLELGGQLDALQGVVGVAALPLHQGLAPSSALRVGLADVICGIGWGRGHEQAR